MGCCAADHRELVLDRINIDTTTGCWVWRNQPDSTGYGRFRHTQGRTLRAHRFAYEAFVGPIPEGLVLDHLCRVPMCVNPSHLEPVTAAENVLRGLIARGCAGGPNLSGVCGHEKVRRADGRGWYCRACARTRYQRGLPDGDPRHGTAGGYANYGCRCASCSEAGLAAARRRRHKARDEASHARP